MKRVAILGAGPAGLLVKHAASLQRVEAHVYSNAVKSHIGGAQFLHSSVPDITTAKPDGVIWVHKWGSAAGYAQKVYGSADAPTSFNLFKEGEVPAWSLRAAYDTLWELYGGEDIMPASGGLKATDVMELQREYDLVISTIPAKALCYEINHRFPAQPVAFTDHAEYVGNWEDYICYSGDLLEPWYRTSCIFGVGQTEYSAGARMPALGKSTAGIKPISTDCDCCRGVLRLGRFGKWQKGVLTHHAFQEAMHALQQL